MATEGSTTGMVLHWARAYDALVWVLTLGRERRFREAIVDLAALAPGQSVLDVGCGTGSLALAARARVGPAGEVAGVDASPEMVARARRKAARAGADVRFQVAAVEALPFPEATFDAVLSTLMLHHLTDDGRREAIGEVVRVLRPGGSFLAVDIGGGTKGNWHRRLPNHAHFDIDAVAPVLDAAGLPIVDRGPVRARVVGLSDLRFLRAAAPA